MSEQRKIRVTAFQTTHYDRTFDTIEDAAAFLGIPATDITPGWTDPFGGCVEYAIADESAFWQDEVPYPDETFNTEDEGEIGRSWSINSIPATEDGTE